MWRIGLAFFIGHCCVHALAVLPPSRPWGWVLLAALGIAIWQRLMLVAVLVLGIAWAGLNANVRLSEDLPSALEGIDLLIQGHVASLPDQRNVEPQFLFDITAADPGVPPRIRLSWYQTAVRPQPGEQWQFVVRLKRRNGFANPGGFDYEGYLFREGIGATGYVRDDSRNQRLAAPSSSYVIVRARAWIAQRLDDALNDDDMLGILQGLAVGETQAMRVSQWRVFAATGTTHLMAISGLHIGMVAAVIAWLGGTIARWPGAQPRRITAIHGQVVGGVLAAVTYAVLAGLSVPTQRTLVMLCVYFAARAWRREASVGHALGLSLIGVLLIDPFAPLAPGAWLSFGAVAAIVLALSGRVRRDNPVMNFSRVQLAVTVGLLPLLLGTFGSVSVVSPLANAIAVPLFTLIIVPLVLIGTLLASVSIQAGGAVLGAAAWLLELGWPALEWLADQPLAMWHFPQVTWLAFAMLIAGVLLLILPGIWPMRLVAILLCLPAFTNRPAPPDQGGFELAILDVGQGLAVVVSTHAHILVYDTGPGFRTGRDTGELVVLPYLHHLGIRKVDMLMVSHGDLDHQGGMNSVVKGIPTESLVLGPSVQYATAPVTRCRAGQRWIWDDVSFEVLHPQDVASARDNDSSCVLRIQANAASALLTGDIEQESEAALVSAGLRQTDIVVVPHHGSRSSSTSEFIRALAPRIAVSSAGYRNRWGFPKTDVVARWQEAHARAYSTIDSGAIEVRIANDGATRVREYRSEQRRYWSGRSAAGATP